MAKSKGKRKKPQKRSRSTGDHPAALDPPLHGPFIFQLLFRENVSVPAPKDLAPVLRKHLGGVELISAPRDKTTVFATTKRFSNPLGPSPFLVCIGTHTEPFDGSTIPEDERRQMRECLGNQDRILSECRYELNCTDFPVMPPCAKERAKLDMDFVGAMVELFPTCEAVLFKPSHAMCPAVRLRYSLFSEPIRYRHFLTYAVSMRLFIDETTGNAVIDTLGMEIFPLPDLQYRFSAHDLEPGAVMSHLQGMLAFMVEMGRVNDGAMVPGLSSSVVTESVQWECRYRPAVKGPDREVLDVHTGQYAPK